MVSWVPSGALCHLLPQNSWAGRSVALHPGPPPGPGLVLLFRPRLSDPVGPWGLLEAGEGEGTLGSTLLWAGLQGEAQVMRRGGPGAQGAGEAAGEGDSEGEA